MELRDFAERILFASTLEEKLQGCDDLTDEHPGPALKSAPIQPGRPRHLEFKVPGEGGHFPGLHQLENARERGRLLHFFCNHELLATELMALVLLRFPDAPPALRRGVWQTLREEQRHTRWYLERMGECGQVFGELPVSGYFWRAVSAMQSPMDFVAGLSLTFEQANLDFAQEYAIAFAKVGDRASAQLLEKIHRDEIAHVAHGLKWFRRWKDPQLDDWTAYCRHLVFPLSPARAKGTRLNVEARRAAGFEPAFISQLEIHAQSKGRTPTVFWFNPFVEGYLAHGPGFTPSAAQAALGLDLANLPQFLARRDDVVLVARRPRVEFLSGLKQAGFELPEFVEASPPQLVEKSGLAGRKLGALRPWGWGPDSGSFLAPLAAQLPSGNELMGGNYDSAITPLYSKAWSAALLRSVWPSLAQNDNGRWLCAEIEIGVPAASLAEVESTVKQIRARGHHRVVIKAAFGLAGQSAIRLWEPAILPAQVRWIESALVGGHPVVVEPWLERVMDFSVQLEMESRGLRVLGFTGLTNDSRGQFQANWVDGDHGRRPPMGLVSALRAAGAPRNWVESLYARIWPALELEILKVGFRGPLGVDAFLYRRAQGDLRLKPVVEINPRHTMGRLTLELMKRVGPGVAGEFRLINQAQLRTAGRATFSDLAREWTARFPPQGAGQPIAKLQDGIIFLTDPTTAVRSVAVLAIGPARRALFATGETTSSAEHVT